MSNVVAAFVASDDFPGSHLTNVGPGSPSHLTNVGPGSPSHLTNAGSPSHVVAFDTETTGFQGAVIQAALVELDGAGREIHRMCGLVLPPPGYMLDPRAVQVHGITSARLVAEAVPNAPAFLSQFVRELRAAHDRGAIVVAHNKRFDVDRLNATLRAYGVDERIDDNMVFCTMRGAQPHCQLKNAAGRARCPKNEELYHILTGGLAEKDVGGALHDAANDACVTARAYIAGRARGWFP